MTISIEAADAVAIGWAAGLFEGEGCITFNAVRSKGKRYRSPRLQLRTTDRDVLDRFARIMGCGSIVTIQNPAHVAAGRKPAWDWRTAAKADVEDVLLRLLPFLGRRRAQKAREALGALNVEALEIVEAERRFVDIGVAMAGPEINDPDKD